MLGEEARHHAALPDDGPAQMAYVFDLDVAVVR